jgi:lysophospholipase L1-like esterase
MRFTLAGLLGWWLLTPVAAQAPTAKHDPSKWDKSIAAFEKQDADKPFAKGGIVFVGSSSFALWNINQAFPDLPVLNRGFGGSMAADSAHFAERLVCKHQPKTVVFYAGDNDIAAKRTPEQVAEDFKTFVGKVHKDVPTARILFISIKPSPSRWKLADQQKQANALVEKFCQGNDKLKYVDVWPGMLGADGMPKAELFKMDKLHMNEDGYKVWIELLRPLLKS